MIPRIKGRVGQAEEGQGFDGKYFFTIWLHTITNKQIGDPFGPYGPFDTEKKALEEMKKAIRGICDHIEKQEFGEASGEYLDMNNGGVMRKWDEA